MQRRSVLRVEFWDSALVAEANGEPVAVNEASQPRPLLILSHGAAPSVRTCAHCSGTLAWAGQSVLTVWQRSPKGCALLPRSESTSAAPIGTSLGTCNAPAANDQASARVSGARGARVEVLHSC